MPRIKIDLPAHFAFAAEIQMAADDFNKYGCDLVWRMTEQASGHEVTRGKHGIVFFDDAARKLVEAPAVFIAKVGG